LICHTAAGALADTRFVAQFFADEQGWSENDNGYLWADQPTWDDYQPWLHYQMNSARGANRVRRTGTGRYAVTFPNFNRGGGNVQVTAYGGDASFCKVENWGVDIAFVNCFDVNGAPFDTRFTILWRDRVLPVAGAGGYVWTNNMTNTNWYTPSSPWNFTTAGPGSARKVSTGVYEVGMPNVGTQKSTVMVTGYGSSNTRCNPESWFGSGVDTIVRVVCLTPLGSFVDGQFTLMYMRAT
jgi:hypothetical protein